MIEAYLMHEEERNAQGIPALPLNPEQTTELCKLLQKPPAGEGAVPAQPAQGAGLPGCRSGRRSQGRFPGRNRQRDEVKSPLVLQGDAVQILGTMIGGYNVAPLVAALKDKELADEAATALSGMTLVYDGFDEVAALAKTQRRRQEGAQVLGRMPNGSPTAPAFPRPIKVKVFKVDGEINTDDFSPAGDAWSRPDIPLHALAMGKTRFQDGLDTIAKFRKDGFQVAFVGDVVGTGSSRKSACNSVLWAHRPGDPLRPQQEDRRRHHRRRHRPDLLQHRPGLRRAAAEGRRHRDEDRRRDRHRHQEG